MQSFLKSEDLITDINVTPMVDIILVVLIIFMATAPLINKRAIDVDVPAASQHDTADIEALEILYSADREIFLAGRRVDIKELRDTLTSIRKSNPDIRVMVAGDKRVPYGEMVGILDAVRGAGIRIPLAVF